MSAKEILKNIEMLPKEDQIKLIEAAKKAIWKSEYNQMKEASISMIHDYLTDKELTSFQALDCENFYETR